MRYGLIYLIVRDFEKSVSFYEKVLDMKVSAVNKGRFAMFNNDGLNIGIMNGYFDSSHLTEITKKGEYFPYYDDMDGIADGDNSRKIFINLCVSDLRAEYERILSLNIADELTPIRFMEYVSPYWYFTFKDPDGNPIEITGEYSEEA